MGFGESLSQESPQDIYSLGAFSSQDSSHWSFDSDLENVIPKSKKSKLKSRSNLGATATLMETQEFGEMMEHEDEVNFALDGLRRGQPPRIRRASLLSLLSICGTLHQRRLLTTHGTAKMIIDAILGLSFDDSPSNLAAAALFFILTYDGQDDHILDSSSCIRFLIKLLNPLTSDATKDKVPTIGSKLLSLRKDAAFSQESKGLDATSVAIMLKVQEILVNAKEMKPSDGDDNRVEKPELSPKWIALLTMEKACLSTISLEETTGTVRKTGGNFKEKLREHGGLDAVFDVARNCHSVMERWLEQRSSSMLESKDNVHLESLALLLKCLKIMENATFLSMENQSHLLGMKENFNRKSAPQFFIKLILRVINILSGVSLLVRSSGTSDDENASEMPSMLDDKVDINEILSISSSVRCCSMEGTSSQKSFNASQNSQWSSETVTTSVADTRLLKFSLNSSTSTSNNRTRVNNSKRPEVIELVEDSQEDPFAFDEEEFEPSKWELLSGRHKVTQTRILKSGASIGECEDGGSQSLLLLDQPESSNLLENCHHHSHGVGSCSSAFETEKSNLLADCLLTSVKVLMNLTNDNPMGCQQIAACGGLETLSSLIACHFPSFSSISPPFKSGVPVGHLTDNELDFLVAILGLLVNLVEKDGQNRSRLAAASVSVPRVEGLENESRDVISLLCSIFLANQGVGEAAGEGKQSALDDEDPVSQGEKEAEKMILEAYAALLLAFLSTESRDIRNAIVEYLPDHKLAILVPVLERFVEFHFTLNMISPETHTTVLEVIESCRVP